MFRALQRNDALVLLIPAAMALCYFLISGGEALWTNTLQRCQALDKKTGIVIRIDCIKSIADYILAAVATFIGAYVITASLRNRTSLSEHKQQRPRSNNVGLSLLRIAFWDSLMLFLMCYPEIGRTKSGEAKLAKPLGTEIFSTFGTDHGMEGAVAVMNTHEQNMFAHVSNLTHGTIYMGTHTVESNLTHREGSWDFGGWGGIKFSYANPGCQGYSFTDADATNELLEEAWNFVNWASYGNKGATCSLQWDDEYRYGTPYVAGYLILEVDGFGTEYEGAPQLNDCLRDNLLMGSTWEKGGSKAWLQLRIAPYSGLGASHIADQLGIGRWFPIDMYPLS